MRKIVLSPNEFSIIKIPGPDGGRDKISIKHDSSKLSVIADTEKEAWAKMFDLLTDYYGKKVKIKQVVNG